MKSTNSSTLLSNYRKDEEERMSSFLPEEIIENILTRLDVKSSSRFKCVSKYWYHLFRNPNFIKNHLNHANLVNNFNILATKKKTDDSIPTQPYIFSIDNDVLSSTSSPFVGHALNIDYPLMSPGCVPMTLGTCNGLVCIKPFPRSMCIWNPATREYKQVPKPSADSESFYFIAHGFGFDCKNDDYKVLRIVSFEETDEVFEASVYSLASNSWKNLGIIPYDFSGCLNCGFFLNGVLHWIATATDDTCLPKVLVGFDISDETFHDVPLPYINNSDVDEDEDDNEYKYEEDPFMLDLGIWEGKLCLLRENHMEEDPDICTHQNDHVDMWTMMDDNKWSEHFKITAQIAGVYYVRPIQTLRNGEILLEVGPRVEEGVGLIAYDPDLETARSLKIHGFPEDPVVETYIKTLVGLNSGTYVGNEKKLELRRTSL